MTAVQSRSRAAVLCDGAGFIRGWTQSAAGGFGHDAAALIGRPLVQLLRFGSAAKSAATLLCADGSEVPVHVTRQELADCGASLVLEELDGMDLATAASLPQHAESQNERVLQQWADAFKHCAHGIAMGEPARNTILVCNPAFARLLQRTPAEVANLPVAEIYAPEFRQRLREWVAEADRSGSVRYEAAMLRRDGSSFAVQVDLVSVLDTQGKPVRRVATVQDIESRLRAERELRTLSAHLQSATEAAPIGLWVWNIADHRLSGNRAQNRMWGIDDERLEQDPLAPMNVVHEGDREALARALERCIHLCQPLSVEFRIVRPSDGQLRWIASYAQPQTDAHGRVMQLVGANLDITDQKLAHEARAQTQRIEALGTLAGGIAHDFNNVLQAVSGNVEVALSELPPDHVAYSCLEEIELASRRAAELVKQILTFSRGHVAAIRPVDMTHAVEEALLLLRATLPAPIEIVFTPPSALPCVSADATQLQQVLVNLATNAAHAIGSAPGRIELALDAVDLQHSPSELLWELRPGRYVRLTVRDSGCGMDAETQRRAFDPFFTTKAPGAGTGLGLSVVHGILRKLSGSIGLTSAPGEGSTFQLYFPATDATPSSEDEEGPVPRGKGERILFVDDERALVNLGKLTLSQYGYQVDAFSDSVEAMLALRCRPGAHAALVTDLSMPKLGGFELARVFLEQQPRRPVILMSGFLGDAERERASALGIAIVLTKPTSFEALARQLGAALRSARRA